MKKYFIAVIAILSLALIPLAASAQVDPGTDNEEPEAPITGTIHRGTHTNYFTKVAIKGTLKNTKGSTIGNFNRTSEEEFDGNYDSEGVQAAANELTQEFENWIAEKDSNATIQSISKGVSGHYYEVHDQITQFGENPDLSNIPESCRPEAPVMPNDIIICTILDKHQIYTINATAITETEEENVIEPTDGATTVSTTNPNTAENIRPQFFLVFMSLAGIILVTSLKLRQNLR